MRYKIYGRTQKFAGRSRNRIPKHAPPSCIAGLCCVGGRGNLFSAPGLREEGTICIYVFYGQGCPHCERAKPVIEAPAAQYPQVQLKTYEVDFNTMNQTMFAEFQQRYGVTEKAVPTLFIGDRALVGDPAICTEREERIVRYTANPGVCPPAYTVLKKNTRIMV